MKPVIRLYADSLRPASPDYAQPPVFIPKTWGEKLGDSCPPTTKRYNERQNIAYPCRAIVLQYPSSENHHEAGG